jgi:hypothetical protein
MKQFKLLIFIQSGYYLLTALWAIIDINSFMTVTGPKTDIWLVKTTAAMIATISLTLGSYLFMQGNKSPAIILGSISAFSFVIIDFYYVAENVISNIYVLDGIFESILLIGWGVVIFKNYVWHDHPEPVNQRMDVR